MIISYSFDDTDFKRQKNEILDVENQEVQLEIKFKDYIKIYGIIFTFLLLIAILV